MVRNKGGVARQFPVRRVTGGRGPAGEKDEGSEGYLWRVLGLAEVDGGGLAVEEQGRRWWCLAAAAFRRVLEGRVGSRSFTKTRGVLVGWLVRGMC